MTHSVTFALPTPPSVNAMYRNVAGKGRVKTAAYTAWRNQAGREMLAQGCRQQPPMTFPVKVTIAVRPRKGNRGDIDNRAKACCDVMTYMGVWQDDALVHDIRILWDALEGQPAHVGCLVTVEELAHSASARVAA